MNSGELGADEVIPEEFETSIEIFSRVLHRYNFPRNVIMDMIDKIRSGSYTALRGMELPKDISLRNVSGFRI